MKQSTKTVKQSVNPRIAILVGEELRLRFLKACEKVGLDEPEVIRSAVQAIVDYVEEHGELSFPMVVLPKSSYVIELIKAETSFKKQGLEIVAKSDRRRT